MKMLALGSRQRVASSRWPNFFIVGAGRAGTTSMWEYLRHHPQIYMTPIKETYFFSDQKPTFMRSISDEQEYLGLFRARDEKVLGEASPNYLLDPAVPRRIKDVSPGARILIILRDPVARAYSFYWHGLRYGIVEGSFAEVVKARMNNDGLLIGGRAGYAPGLRRYLDHFGPRVLVLIFEEFVADVRGHVRQVLEFLEVDPAYADHFDTTRRNPSALPRNALMQWVYRHHRLRAVVSRLVPNAIHGRLERAVLAEPAAPPMEDAVRSSLEELYQPDVVEVERILGRRLPWPTARAELSGPSATPL
jgi:hypothetical protein